MSGPCVSVILPVYNGERYLAGAVSSILAQSLADFELIIINDGSSDATAAILGEFRDPRIRLYHQDNRGLPATLNRGIELAQGRYLARQDADDLSFPERLARQVEVMEKTPELSLVGTWARVWVEDRETERTLCHPCRKNLLPFSMLFDTHFVHSSVMIRKSVLERVGFYSVDSSRQPEDFELWSRILQSGVGSVANLPEFLVAYREVEGSICRSNSLLDGVIRICRENLAWASGRDAADPVIGDLAALSHHALDRVSARPDFRAMRSLLRDAAAFLSAGVSVPLLDEEVATRYANVRNVYLLHRYRWLHQGVRRFLGR